MRSSKACQRRKYEVVEWWCVQPVENKRVAAVSKPTHSHEFVHRCAFMPMPLQHCCVRRSNSPSEAIRKWRLEMAATTPSALPPTASSRSNRAATAHTHIQTQGTQPG
jgi:hypothetical protein